ncbi:MAG TPA: hypothetical protein VLR94_03320 [Acidobacteriota bacterium]|nr:hypothetical protein [Acidobacteriota bacterium]
MANENKLPLELTEEQNLEELAAQSDLIFVGVVLQLGRPPQNWSGHLTEYQTVQYRVERLLKGKHAAEGISVDHVVVSGSKTAAEKSPALSPSLFSVNAKLIVSARKANSGLWKALDENYGAIPATPEWIAKVESALRK